MEIEAIKTPEDFWTAVEERAGPITYFNVQYSGQNKATVESLLKARSPAVLALFDLSLQAAARDDTNVLGHSSVTPRSSGSTKSAWRCCDRRLRKQKRSNAKSSPKPVWTWTRLLRQNAASMI